MAFTDVNLSISCQLHVTPLKQLKVSRHFEIARRACMIRWTMWRSSNVSTCTSKLVHCKKRIGHRHSVKRVCPNLIVISAFEQDIKALRAYLSIHRNIQVRRRIYAFPRSTYSFPKSGQSVFQVNIEYEPASWQLAELCTSRVVMKLLRSTLHK